MKSWFIFDILIIDVKVKVIIFNLSKILTKLQIINTDYIKLIKSERENLFLNASLFFKLLK